MLINKKYSNFISKAISDQEKNIFNYELAKNIGKQGTILFFIYQDFYEISKKEVIELSEFYENFQSLGVNLAIISVDSELTHLHLLNELKKDKKHNFNIPLVSDITKDISRDYSSLIDESYSLPTTVFVDKKGFIKSFSSNDINIKRDINSLYELIKNIITSSKI